MKLALVADVHVGNHGRFGGPVKAGLNDRCRLVLDVLKEAVSASRFRRADAFVSLGDLFDRASPSPQVVRATAAALDESPGQPWLLLGNHEMTSTDEGDNALAVLRGLSENWLPGALVFDGPALLGTGVLLVPYRPGPAVEWLPEVVASFAKHARPGTLLLTHVGIWDDETPEFLRGAQDAVPVELMRDLCAWHGLGGVAAGNWHKRRLWTQHGAPILQVGALCPTGFSDDGEDGYGTVAIWDTERPGTFEHVTVGGPRFFRVDWRPGLPPASHYLKGYASRAFVQVTANPEDVPNAASWAKEGRGERITIEVRPAEGEARRRAREAGAAASRAETLDEAIASYVERADLPSGVRRDEVLAAVRGYMREG